MGTDKEERIIKLVSEGSKEALIKAIEEAGEDISLLYAARRYLYEKRKAEEGLIFAKRILEIDPKNPDDHKICGKIYDKLNKYSDAEYEFNEAIRRSEDKYLFCWDDIPGSDSERFIEFLIQNFKVTWIETEKIEKNELNKTINICDGKNIISLKLNLNKENMKAEFTIDDRPSYDFIVKIEDDKRNIYSAKKRSEVRTDLASLLITLERIKEAQRQCKKAIKEDSINKKARKMLGGLLSDQGRYKEAEKEYIEVLRIDQTDHNTQYRLGDTYYELKCYEKAKEAYEEAYVRFERNSEEKKKHLFSWGSVPGDDSAKLMRFLKDDLNINWIENSIIKLEGDKKLRIFAAEKSVEITLDENKKKATLKISDGRTYTLQLKEENGKLNIYKIKNKKLSELLAHLGKTLVRLKKYCEAEKKYKEAIDLNEHNAGAYNDLGVLFKELGDEEKDKGRKVMLYEKALQEFKNAHEKGHKGQKYAIPHNNSGIVSMELKRISEARESFEQAIEDDYSFVDAHINLGVLYAEELNNYEKAIEEFEKALRIDPGNPMAYSNLLLAKSKKKIKDADWWQASRVKPTAENAFFGIVGIILILIALYSLLQPILQGSESTIETKNIVESYGNITITNKKTNVVSFEQTMILIGIVVLLRFLPVINKLKLSPTGVEFEKESPKELPESQEK